MDYHWTEEYDVCVVGAGHAGCEAALACARRGLETIIFTVSVDSIAMMPCNPNIGGSSKGHLVRELDALGGEMGKNIDKTFIQSKMLNVSKGPAVHSLRKQADKSEYSREMRRILEGEEHLTIRQGEISELLLDDQHRIKGCVSFTGTCYLAKAVILCTGVYLNSRCLTGSAITCTGPNGLQSATHLTDSLIACGITIKRFKTGTPARMDGKSLDYSKMIPQPGDERVIPFSFSTDPESVQIPQVPCYLTYTNEETHRIIRENLDRSPIYAGIIEGTGPRYCPSIEDKVVKFPDHERHQLFIEPEGRYTDEMYVDGMSSSMPEDVQIRMYRTVPGLEHCRIVRNAYAIEYDCIDARQLKLSLEFKHIPGLFAAGQINGSSGYEEAAAQGIIAGINAGNMILGKEAYVPDRSEAYIGVLIDDLITKDNKEPYRMMTSRAEYRLFLRQDNADIRLMEKGYEFGLISAEQINGLRKKIAQIAEECGRLKRLIVSPSERNNACLKDLGASEIKTGVSLAALLSRPELTYENLKPLDPERPELPKTVKEQVQIELKYAGYIERQNKQVKAFKKLETKKIPENIDYDQVSGLRLEARQHLKEHRPENLGQAGRIAGVNPADVNVLWVYLK